MIATEMQSKPRTANEHGITQPRDKVIVRPPQDATTRVMRLM